MKIPTELVPLSYKLSRDVFNGKLTHREAKEELSGNGQMNPNSAADYLNNFKRLIQGDRFSRTLNAFSMDYFIKNIHSDFGSVGLSNALNALIKHINYYEGLQNVKMHKMWAIYYKYLSFLNETPDEQEQNEILQTLEKEKQSREELLVELKNLKPSDPEIILINNKSYKRDNLTIAKIKRLRGSKCQICSQSIKRADGSFYIEAAHITPKHERGFETWDNIILLCPNHHKEFDLGKTIILNRKKDFIHFIMNEKEFKISL
jgi:hypothetical protein